MHELSIAQNIVDFALSEADKNNAMAVSEVFIDVGELMQVEVDVLEKALGLLMAGPRLAGCSVHMQVEAASFQCRRCDASWGMEEARRQLERTPDSLRVKEPDSIELPLHFLPSLYSAFLHCPKCGSVDIVASAGEDIRLRRLVME